MGRYGEMKGREAGEGRCKGGEERGMEYMVSIAARGVAIIFHVHP